MFPGFHALGATNALQSNLPQPVMGLAITISNQLQRIAAWQLLLRRKNTTQSITNLKSDIRARHLASILGGISAPLDLYIFAPDAGDNAVLIHVFSKLRTQPIEPRACPILMILMLAKHKFQEVNDILPHRADE